MKKKPICVTVISENRDISKLLFGITNSLKLEDSSRVFNDKPKDSPCVQTRFLFLCMIKKNGSTQHVQALVAVEPCCYETEISNSLACNSPLKHRTTVLKIHFLLAWHPPLTPPHSFTICLLLCPETSTIILFSSQHWSFFSPSSRLSANRCCNPRITLKGSVLEGRVVEVISQGMENVHSWRGRADIHTDAWGCIKAPFYDCLGNNKDRALKVKGKC